MSTHFRGIDQVSPIRAGDGKRDLRAAALNGEGDLGLGDPDRSLRGERDSSSLPQVDGGARRQIAEPDL